MWIYPGVHSRTCTLTLFLSFSLNVFHKNTAEAQRSVFLAVKVLNALCDEESSETFAGLTYCYLNLRSDSLLREAFTVCPHFQCSQYKNKKTKLEAEVIKLIVKLTLMEVGGEESHKFGFVFFFPGVFLLLLAFRWFQRLSKGKISAVPALRSQSAQSSGIWFTWSSSKPAAHWGIHVCHKCCCVSLSPNSQLGQKQR